MVNGKSRHWSLTAFLIFMLVANSASVLINLLAIDELRATFPNAPGWAWIVLIVFGAFNVVCVIALFMWKKWGFWGLCASAFVISSINLFIGLEVGAAVAGLIGLSVLYVVLHIGSENKGWPQLE